MRTPMTIATSLLLAAGTLAPARLPAQAADRVAAAVASLKLRGIGPALMGGRIADIAVHPTVRGTWYVAVGSGGVWKTTNAGVTWTPVFDDQPSYSIGDVALDPSNPDVVWVGTGENVSGRHVGWGSGVYRSRNGGRTWQQMGLTGSQHIGKILVRPDDGNTVFVAAEGPLWSAGGERGLYRSTDGGATWTAVLTIGEHTGITDVEFDPSNPDLMYAAAYQRRRHIWSLLGGGPESGIYKSTDGGDTWRRVTTGLPSGDMGKIGLAVTPADPAIVYATIEADAGERGFYRSRDRGESWERRDDYISGGTGPHYYQEIEASPVDPDLVYQMDVFLHVTRDGGDTFDYLETGWAKHSDNHALWIDPTDGRHLLVGTDAGLYESFDEGATWRHFPNLPVSQFYKLALDNSEPFYNVLGGAQDLGTLFGPSRTTNVEGVRNQDWYVPLGADGYGVAFDPGDPHLMYMEIQQGELVRVDRRTNEVLDIKPQPAPGDPPERWNWDAPLLVSPHDPARIYFGSQRLWRSDDRGDSWAPVSGDLTTNRNRYELELMGRVWSVDALYDNGAMSKYATLTAITESPLAEGVLYTGSDDGLIHVTEDGGTTWRAARTLPGLPPLAFVNDVEASQHDANVVFAIADNHKMGDFSPYVFVSGDRGRSWRSIAGDLPAGTIAWAIQQDHVNQDLLFLGTEFGLYVTLNGGANWHRLGGAPTIPFRDLKIHRRDDDVVGATFGRGFYVLDDYAPLRTMGGSALAASTLFPVRDAWWYVPNEPMQARGMPTLGTDSWRAPNPPFGAVFTYHLADVPKTQREARRETEKQLRERGENIPFPGWDRLRAEAVERGPLVLLLVRDAAGEPVRWIEGDATAGLHRAHWDLRRPAPDPVDFSTPDFTPPWAGEPQGPLAPPGTYSVELMLVASDGVTSLGAPQSFAVKPLPTAPAGTDFVQVAAFQQETADLARRIAAADQDLERAAERLRYMQAALLDAPAAPPALFARMDRVRATIADVALRLSGDRTRSGLNESTAPSIADRVGRVVNGHWNTRQMPTATQRRSIEIAATAFAEVRDAVTALHAELDRLDAELEAAGAPGRRGG